MAGCAQSGHPITCLANKSSNSTRGRFVTPRSALFWATWYTRYCEHQKSVRDIMSSGQHITIDRRFSKSSEEQLSDPQYQRAMGGYFASHTSGWDDLITRKRVIVLGEGKCGKTHEFQQQVLKLNAQGNFAFFIRLERLADGSLEDTLSPEEERKLNAWLGRADEKPAWFFLDAVDELKLRDGSFRVALRKIQRAIAPKVDRAHILVSCRPADWNQQIDIADLMEMFPNSTEAKAAEVQEPQDMFISVLKKETHGEQREESQDETTEADPQIFVLLSLTPDEIVSFAQRLDPSRASAFKGELERNDAWALFQSPSDIIDGMALLNENGHLGSLLDQVEAGIRIKLKEQTTRARRCTLSLAKAREGAERLALALFLTKRRSLFITKHDSDDDALHVGDVLTDWMQKEQQELLSRGLFDPSGVNAVRFHHRSTQEYLAARRLEHHRASGLPIRELKQLLFADTWGHSIVVPSMEPIAAWLSLMNADIATELRNRKPDVLFRQGIPGSMTIPLRSTLLHDFVRVYNKSDWRGISIDTNDVKRLAHPELAPTVRELWTEAYPGHETREILLELILNTPLPSCVDLAAQAAVDGSIAEHHRVYAMRAVLALGSPEQKRAVAEQILSKQVSSRIVTAVLDDTFPDPLTISEVVTIARETKQQRNTVHGLNYALYNLMHSDKITTTEVRELRSALATSIWGHRNPGTELYNARSKYDHFIDAVFAGCARDETLETPELINLWAAHAALAFHFGERQDSIIAEEDCKSIRARIASDLSIREAYFWAVFDLYLNFGGTRDGVDRFFHYDERTVMGQITAADFSWLFRTLESPGQTERTRPAFFAIMDAWRTDRHTQVADRVLKAIGEDPELVAEHSRYLNPPKSGEIEKWQTAQAKRDAAYQKKEDARVRDWVSWKERLSGDPDAAFTPEARENTLYNFFTWLDMSGKSHSTWGEWSEDLVLQAFPPEFVTLLKRELSSYWRHVAPVMWSEKPVEARNQTSRATIHALSAIKSEAVNPQWASHLNPAEAILAAKLSTVELNGFAPFYASLEAAHPEEAQGVILAELEAQVRELYRNGQCPILHDIFYHGTPSLKAVAAASLVPLLSVWPSDMDTEAQNALRYTADLMAQHLITGDRADAVHSLEARIDAAAPLSSGHAAWLCALLVLNPGLGSDYWLRATEDFASAAVRDFAILTIGAVFGDRYHSRQKPNLSPLTVAERARLLGRLVHRTYQVAHPSTDIQHHGVHSPGDRDLAEEARRFLFDSLVGLECAEANDILREFSELDLFKHMKDRLLQLRIDRAAKHSEIPAMTAAQFAEFDSRQAMLPTDVRTMHLTTMNRLDDFRHHVLESEFSNRGTLQLVASELEMRRNIAGWLSDHSRGVYHVNQEAVKKDEKRTDIRLNSTAADIESAIELKIEDNGRWSLSALETALREQLVGQYLSHERCRSGCLAIVLRGKHQWRNPIDGTLMEFPDVIERLQGIADGMMRDRPELMLSVYGLDIAP